MTNTNILPEISDIIGRIGGKESRDGKSVIVGYGGAGYARLTPDYVIRDGQELPAVTIEIGSSVGRGAKKAEMRRKVEAAGWEARG